MLPMGGAPGPYEPTGIYKPWASATEGGFPCCWGTLAESFSKLGDSIYFKSPGGAILFVNLFESSSVSWNGLNITQTATFPLDVTRTTLLTVAKVGSSRVNGNTTIALRVPFWATGNNTITVSGETIPAAKLTHSSYVSLSRLWKTGDEITVHFPLSLRFEQVDDPRAPFAGFGTFFYGPLLLAGITTDQQLIVGNRTVDQVLVRNSTAALTFEATPTDVCGNHSKPVQKVAMIPLNQIRNEHYSVLYQVYFHTQVFGRTIPAGDPELQFAQGADFKLSGGATVLSNSDVVEDESEAAHHMHRHDEHSHDSHHGHGHAGHAHVTSRALEDPQHSHFATNWIDYDQETGNHYGPPSSTSGTSGVSSETTQFTIGLGSALNLRSGSPGAHSMAAMSAPFKGAAKISSISFSYRYVIGYGTKANSTGSSVSFAFLKDLDCPTTGEHTILYTSPRYLEPSWDKCHECYSAPINISVTGLGLQVEQGGALAFMFDNGDHNMQLLLPIDVAIGWKG
jgi:hypothetical protein